MVEDIQKILEMVIKDNNWGLYFKANPLENLPSQDGQHIYKVNDVSGDDISNAVQIAIEKFLNEKIT